jgi:hypothetical protein
MAFGIATKRIQRGGFDVGEETARLGVKPSFVDGAGAADDGVEEPRVQASGLVTGQVDDNGDGPVDPDPRRPPNMLIDAESPHAPQPVGIIDAGLGFDLDRIPAGVPVHSKVPGQRCDGGVVVAERVCCPTHRSRRERRTRRRHVVGLAEGTRGTQGLWAPPHPHQPAEQGDPTKARRIVQHPDPAAVADRQHPTGRAGRLQLAGLHSEHQALLVVDLHLKDMHVGNIEDRIGPGAPTRARTTNRVRHRRALRRSVG